MKIHSLIQGSPEWLAYRAHHFNASDAPAMMGCSPYKTRAELLREMHTGVVPDVDVATRKRYEGGHRAEALARPLAEQMIGSELYPVTGSDGRYSASFDGLTMDETTGFEHKALSAELRAAFADMLTIAPEHRDQASCRSLPLMHRLQMEQQLLISGAERILFMASEWNDNDELVEERDCWYYPDPKLRADLVAGWAQFERDLAVYVLPDSAEPATVGKAPDTLPALRIEVSGQVTASNLAEFKQTALAAIRSVNRELTTDQDFADAEKSVKWCADVEDRLKAAKEHALSQTSSIDVLFKAIDDISAEARRVRLDIDRLVTRRKTEVKEEAVVRARKSLAMHVSTLYEDVATIVLPMVTVDFAGAIKGKRSISTMHDALDAALTKAKIDIESAAQAIRANLALYKERVAGHEFLFPDLDRLLQKAPDDLARLIQARIDSHKAIEARQQEAAQAAANVAVAPVPAQPAQAALPLSDRPAGAAVGVVAGAEPEVWVVVCQNDKPHPRYGIDPGGPIVWERYTRDATKASAMETAAQLERFGPCRIARLVFDDAATKGR